MVNLYTIALPYSAENIKIALHDRLKTEGIKGKKTKNNFYAFKGVKYTHLWDNTCDIYVSITGNKEAGNVNLIISQGYDNYVDPYKDTITTEKAYKWLMGVDRVVYEYMHEQYLATHLLEQKNIEIITEEEYNEAMNKYIERLQKLNWPADHYRYGNKMPTDEEWERKK